MLVLAIQLVSACASEQPQSQSLTTRQTPFSGTADAIDNFDPHNYVPPSYRYVRIAHATTMSVVWLLIFPLGGIIPRVMTNRRLVWVHAIMQMVGFWLNVGAAAMGIWMAREIKQVCICLSTTLTNVTDELT